MHSNNINNLYYMEKDLKIDIRNTVDISENDLNKVIAKFQIQNFAKLDRLALFNKVSDHLKFIQDGLVRVYNIDEQGKELTIQIGIEGMWINDIYSFFTQTPSENHIEFLDETSILQISRKDLEILFSEVPIMERFFRLKLEQSYVRLYKRTIQQQNRSAKDRYLDFKIRYGHIEPLVPQYIIASYLNLTPEHLSKVRNQLAKE